MMQKLKRVIWFLLGLWAIPALTLGQELDSYNTTILYDLDATDFTYCKLVGLSGNPRTPIPARYRIETTASASAVTEAVASTNPFTELSVKDVIVVARPDGTTDVRVINVKTDAANVTINADVNWDVDGGFGFSWYKVVCGTTDADGWVDVRGGGNVGITFYLEQVNVTGGIDVRWECKSGGVNAKPGKVYPGESSDCGAGTLSSGNCNFTTAGVTSWTMLAVDFPVAACRLGMKIGTADDGDDLTTNAERITVTIDRVIQ